jgi:hypothetical protein
LQYSRRLSHRLAKEALFCLSHRHEKRRVSMDDFWRLARCKSRQPWIDSKPDFFESNNVVAFGSKCTRRSFIDSSRHFKKLAAVGPVFSTAILSLRRRVSVETTAVLTSQTAS